MEIRIGIMLIFAIITTAIFTTLVSRLLNQADEEVALQVGRENGWSFHAAKKAALDSGTSLSAFFLAEGTLRRYLDPTCDEAKRLVAAGAQEKVLIVAP